MWKKSPTNEEMANEILLEKIDKSEKKCDLNLWFNWIKICTVL